MNTASTFALCEWFVGFPGSIRSNVKKPHWKRVGAAVFIVAWLLGLSTTGALADTVSLSPAVFQEQADGASQPFGTPTAGQADLVGSTCTVTPAGCQTSEAETVEDGIVAQADGIAGGDATASSQAAITYQFAVTGTSEPVQLFIYGFASAAVDGVIASAEAQIAYSTSEGPFNFEMLASQNGLPSTNTGPESGNLFNAFMQAPGEIGTVTVYATCTVRTFTGYNGTCNADADPYITIDPTFLAANPGATLELSSGIEQVAPGSSSGGTTPPGTMPEPGTLALMALGLPLLAAIRNCRGKARPDSATSPLRP